MAKTKFNRYQGVRKRRKNKIIVTQTAVQEATVVARPEVNTEEENGQSKSASLKKLAFFNLELDAMVKEKENLEEQVTDGCLLIVSKSSLSKLISKLCCPNCKQPGGLQLLQEIAYKLKIKQLLGEEENLIRYLVSKIVSAESSFTLPCLGSLANICRSNANLQDYIKAMVFNKNNMNQMFHMVFSFILKGNSEQVRRHSCNLLIDFIKCRQLQEYLAG
eukprot:gene7049-7840_t